MAKLTVRKVQQLTGHNGAIYALAPGPEPHTFLSAGGDGWVVQWSLKEKDEQGELLGHLIAKVDTQVFSLTYIPTTNTVVAGDMNGGVHWLNLSEDRPNRHIAHHKKGTFGVIQIGEELITIGGAGVLTKWDVLRQSSSESLHLSNQALRSLTYVPDQEMLIIGSSDHSIFRVNAKDFEVLEQVPASHDNSVFALHSHPLQPAVLYSGGRDAQLKKWSLSESLVLESAQPAHWYTINDLIADPSGAYLLSASRDRNIRVWDSEQFKLLWTLDAARDGGHVNSVNRLLWIPDSSYFVSASDDRSLILWELSIGEE